MCPQLIDTATTADVWPLDMPNAYRETRAAAIARVEAALYDAARAAIDCGPDCEGREDMEQAAADLATIKEGSRGEFSLDGIAAWSWTILADSAADAACRAEFAACHD